MKSGDKDTLAYSRNLHAAIRKKEIDDRRDLDDAEIQKIIGTLMKQRQESIDQFRKGNRPDLVANEEAEYNFLKKLMPEQISESELRTLVLAAVKEVGASGPKEMGKVMQALMPKTQGRADGRLVSQLVREALEPAKTS